MSETIFDTATYGDAGCLITLKADKVSSVSKYLKENLPNYEVREGLESILISDITPNLNLCGEVIQKLSNYTSKAEENNSLSNTHHLIEVDYTGEDLRTIAENKNITVEEYVKAHSNLIYRVALIGFAPGFPYLTPASGQNVKDIETALNIPRLSNPRLAVPKGSVAVAAGMSAIYPKEMPGGWNLIGFTETELFNLENTNPSLLKVGDTVQFTIKDAK